MTIRKFAVDLTTDSGGAATGYTPYFSGYIRAIQYAKDGGANPFANGVDFTVTADATGESILALTDQNSSVTVRPRAATHSVAGVASVYASGGTAVNDRIALARDRVKIVIAQGGNTKVGRVYVTVETEKW